MDHEITRRALLLLSPEGTAQSVRSVPAATLIAEERGPMLICGGVRHKPLKSYRARILTGEYDWHHPDVGTAVIGLKARTAERAASAAIWVSGLPVLEVWSVVDRERLALFLPSLIDYPAGTSAAEWAAYLAAGGENNFALGRMDAEPLPADRECPTCGGHGSVERRPEGFTLSHVVRCEDCDGSGRVERAPEEFLASVEGRIAGALI